MTHLHIEQFYLPDDRWPKCQAIRKTVFIEEQRVPEALEWDAEDGGAMHLLGIKHGTPIACARVLYNGYIGRMAVLPEWRRQGVGLCMLQSAIEGGRALSVPCVRLSAQVHAIDFYRRAGFKVTSEPYLDANILHVDMQLELI